MSETIILPTCEGLHFGAASELKHFENCYFEEIHSETFITPTRKKNETNFLIVM